MHIYKNHCTNTCLNKSIHIEWKYKVKVRSLKK